MFSFPIALIAVLVIVLFNAVKIVPEYERLVVFRLGRLVGSKGPGIVIVIPGIDKYMRVDLRTLTLDVPSQDVITKDNIPVNVNAVCYFRVIDPNKAVNEIKNFVVATSQISQTSLRSVVGQAELDDLLSERDKINSQLQKIIDQQTDPWGIKVSIVEIKDVQIPEQMQRAIAAQAEAERDRRSKIINAEGEFQAAQKLVDAAKMMENHPIALQLRYLRTVTEVASDKNSTTFFPFPIDLLKPFLKDNK